MTITTDLGEKTLDELTGLHEESHTTLEDLKDSLEDILSVITGFSKDGGKVMSEMVTEVIKSVVGNKEADTEESSDTQNDSKPGKVSTKVNVSDLNGYSGKYIMGALLINSTLLSMQQQLGTLVQTIAELPKYMEFPDIGKQIQAPFQEVSDNLKSILDKIPGSSIAIELPEQIQESLNNIVSKIPNNEGLIDSTGSFTTILQQIALKMPSKEDIAGLSDNIDKYFQKLNTMAPAAPGKPVVTDEPITTLKEMQSVLLSIEDLLNQISSQIPGNKKSKSPKAESPEPKEKKASITGLDPKSFENLGKTFKIFAEGAVILALVPSALVKKATESFAIFVNKMIESSKSLAASMKDFESFARGLTQIIGCLKTYATATIILALTLPFAPLALVNIGFMAKMISTLTTVAIAAGKAHPIITELTRVFLQLGLSFLLYGLALTILINVGKHFIDAMKGLLAMITFIGTLIVIGLLCVPALMALAGVTSVMISLAVSMILFSIAIKLMQSINVQQESVDNVLNAIQTITTRFSAMMGMVWGAFVTMLGFLTFSILFLTTLIIFNAGLLLLKLSDILIGLVAGEKGDFPVIQRIQTMMSMFSDGDFIKNTILSALGMIAFLLFSALFTVSILVFTVGVVLLWVTDKLLLELTDPDTGENKAVNKIGMVAKQMAENTGWWTLGLVASIPAIGFAAELAVFALLASVAAEALVSVKKNMSELGSDTDIKNIAENLKNMGLGVMLGFLGIQMNPGENISLGVLWDATKNAAKLAALGVDALLAIAPMASFMRNAQDIGKAFESLQASMKDISPELIKMVFEGLSMVMNSLADTASAFKGQSAETVQAVGELVKNVAEAMNLLVDMVIKLKDGIPEEQINAATTAMLRICERLFGHKGDKRIPGQYTLCDTLETIASADLQDLNLQAVQAITPLIDGIDRMADLVVKLSDESRFSEEVINKGVDNMNRFLSAVIVVSQDMMALVKKEASGEKNHSRWDIFGLFDTDVMVSPLEAVQQVVESGFFDTFSRVLDGLQTAGRKMSNLDTSGIENSIQIMSSSAIPLMSRYGQDFVNGMGKMQDGMKKLNESHINNFKNFINAMSLAGNDSFRAGLESFIKLGNIADKFTTIATAMSSIADAMKKMADRKRDLVAIYDAIANSHVGKQDFKTPTNAEEALGGTTINPYVEKIYDVLTDWNRNGIPVRAQLNKETGEVKPTEAGNGVGQSWSRK